MKFIKKLEDEIRKLEQELKIDLPRELQRAASYGDLRENGEYHAARERQSYVQARLGALHHRMASLSMIQIDQLPKDRAAYGSELAVLDIDRDTESVYRLVTPEEVDVVKGFISTTSPLGRSFMGKEEGDEVIAQTPQGTRRFEILKLRTIHDLEEDE